MTPLPWSNTSMPLVPERMTLRRSVGSAWLLIEIQTELSEVISHSSIVNSPAPLMEAQMNCLLFVTTTTTTNDDDARE